ncbi:MAG: hypothetical protein ABI743_02145 [bacterium]
MTCRSFPPQCGYALVLVGLLAAVPASAKPVTSEWPLTGTKDVKNFKKPANYIHNENYSLYVETTPPVPRAGEPFHLAITLLKSEEDDALELEPINGAPFVVIVVDRRGREGDYLVPAPIQDWEGGYSAGTRFDASGGHMAFVAFKPVDQPMVIQRFPFWIEGEAHNGVDISHNDAVAAVWNNNTTELDGKTVSLRTNDWVAGQLGGYCSVKPSNSDDAVPSDTRIWFVSDDMERLVLGDIDVASGLYHIDMSIRRSGFLWAQFDRDAEAVALQLP